MNRKKAGAPYRYAESLFLALAAIRCLTGASYEALEGLARQAPGDDGTPRHARTCGRINGTKAGIRGGTAIAPGSKRAVRMATDSSGLQRNDRGERMTKKWKLKRGFVRARVLAGVDARRVLALKVTDEKTGDAPVFETLVTEAVAALDRAAARGEARGKEAEEKEEAAATIAAEAVRSASEEAAAEGAEKVIYADGAYASRKNVALCKELGIVPFIKMGKNATTAGKGEGDEWGRVVREQLGFGTKYVSDLTAAEKAASMEAWKAASRYGRRWTIEIIFSAVKRLFGSDVRALKWKNIVQEVSLKVALYNRLVGMASKGIG